jgi:hypothetical protein
MRLHQNHATGWLFCDYAGRITALTILAAVPSARIAAFPTTVLGAYPHSTGWLKSFDLTFGLALVAASEEVIFRQSSASISALSW